MKTKEELREMRKNGELTNDEYMFALEQMHQEEKKKTRNNNISPEKMRQYILFSIASLGVFSVLTGLGLIIAANWEIIPAMVKVAAGLGLLVLSLFGVSYSRKSNKIFLSEEFLLVSFLLIGGNIALIQQTYHFALTLAQGSFIWWLLSLPLLFLTRYSLLLLCSIALLGFSAWDYIWRINYMLLAGILFVFMMATHFFEGKIATLLRHLAYIFALFVLYGGDAVSHSGVGDVGIVTTTIFLLSTIGSSKNEKGIVRYYNCLFIFVAWRIFLLFWSAYYNLTSIGIMLVCFGSILLAGVGLYYYYFNQIQKIIRDFVTHGKN